MKKFFNFFKPKTHLEIQVEQKTQHKLNGYTLNCDYPNHNPSIINTKKGGTPFMTKTVVKALEGFEKQFDDLTAMKENLTIEIEDAKAVAIAEVEKKYEAKSTKIDELLKSISVEEEIEVEEEVVEEEQQVEPSIESAVEEVVPSGI